MNALDRVIAYVSPARARRRAINRLANQQLRMYEAAGRGRRFAREYLGRGTSANTEITRAAPLLRDRHRYMVRNNPWAARAVQAIVTNTVGFGITGELSRRGKRSVPDELERQWAEYCDTPYLVDAYGQHDLYGLQSIVMRNVVESGECLAVRVRSRTGTSRVKLLEPDHLDHGKDGALPDGGRIVQGVEYDSQDRIAGYWLFPQHPGDSHVSQHASRRAPADEVLHIYRVDRPGQARGVAWGHPVMVSLSDLDEYEDAYLFRQKLANCVTGIFEDIDPIPSHQQDSTLPAEDLEPGAMLHAPPGKKVSWSTPPRAGDYGPFTKDVLLRVAAGYGISYQALTGDLTSVNFSSGRMGWVEFQRNLESWRWQMLIPMFCDGVARWWMEDKRLLGQNTAALFVEWTPPRREMFDPTREGPAMRDLVRAGLKSLKSTHREMGMRTSSVFKEIAEENAAADELGLVLDTDPRRVSRAGLAQALPTNMETEDGDETED